MVDSWNRHQIPSHRVARLTGSIVMDIFLSDRKNTVLQLFIEVFVGLFCKFSHLIKAEIPLIGIIRSNMML